MVGVSSRLLFLLTNPTSFLHHRPSALIRLVRHQSLTFPFTTLSAAPNHLCRLTRPNSLIPTKFSQKIYSTSTNYAFPENNRSPANSHHVPTSHPWPEWARLIESITVAGYNNGNSNIEDEFVANENLSMEFVAAANSCLAFARNRPDVLCWLPRKDIEVLIDDGYPFLFKNAHETERRMRSFLQVSDFNEASSVAFMKYILSYASTPIIYPERKIKENTESSVRSLLQEMASLINRPRASEQFQAVGRDEQMPRNCGPNITMKRGDWICPKCNFMNFARNTKCLECEELRPQRQLTGGEWDCPRCNFFNFPKNIVCLRCECRRPDEAQLNGSNLGYVSSVPIQNHSAEAGRDSQSPEISTTYATSRHIQDIDKEDKTERWFKKVKELHGVTSDVSHDDFPQIIPMRKEENRSVDNKRKDPPSSPYQRKQAIEQGSTSSFVPFVPFPPDYFSKKVDQQQPKDTDTTVKLTDEISSHNSQVQSNFVSLDMNHVQGAGNQQMSSTNNLDSGMSSRDTNLGSYRNQFTINEPKPETSYVGQKIPETPNGKSSWIGKSLEGSAVTEPDPLDMSEEAKAERWFRRVAQIKDISELSQIPDEDFPSIMPMRKGVNRFVVSKRKTPLERRLTSPQYRKNLRIMSSDPMKKEGNDDS